MKLVLKSHCVIYKSSISGSMCRAWNFSTSGYTARSGYWSVCSSISFYATESYSWSGALFLYRRAPRSFSRSRRNYETSA